MFAITAELLVDGAVAESMNFETDSEYEAWLHAIKMDAPNWDADVSYEVYRVDHTCGGIEDCTCAQYILAHVPEWSRPYARKGVTAKTPARLDIGDCVALHGRVTTIGYSPIHRMYEVTCELLNGDSAAFWVAPDDAFRMFE